MDRARPRVARMMSQLVWVGWRKLTGMVLAVAGLLDLTATALGQTTAPARVTELREAWFIQSTAPGMPDASAAWQPQVLPDSWRESRPGEHGYGWYRATFSLDAPLVPEDPSHPS